MGNIQECIAIIQELVKNKNVSIHKMLKDCGLNKSVIDNMKRGQEPSVYKLEAIADYFDVPVDYLIGRKEQR